jgi:hypothetical protein
MKILWSLYYEWRPLSSTTSKNFIDFSFVDLDLFEKYRPLRNFETWTRFRGRDQRLDFTEKRSDSQKRILYGTCSALNKLSEYLIISSQTWTNRIRKLKVVSVTEFHQFLSFHWGRFRTLNRKILRKKFDFSYSKMIKNIFSMNRFIFFCHSIEISMQLISTFFVKMQKLQNKK